jgi:hypothetical protein
MKTWQVVLRSRGKVLVEAERYEDEGERIVFYPRDPSGDQFFVKDDVLGVSVFLEEDASGGSSSSH